MKRIVCNARFVILLAVCTLSSFCLGRPRIVAEARAEQILAMAQRAKGGKAALEQVKSFSVTTIVTEVNQGHPQSFRLLRYFAGDFRMRTESFYPETKRLFLTGLNDDASWHKDGEQFTQEDANATAKKRKIFLTEWFITFLRVFSTVSAKIAAFDDVALKAKQAEVVLIKIGDAQITAYFDKKSHLLIKADSDFVADGRTFKSEEWFEDYRIVSGIRMAHRSAFYVDGKLEARTLVKNYVINPRFNPQTFTRP